MEQNKKLKNNIKTTIRDFLNENSIYLNDDDYEHYINNAKNALKKDCD